MSKARELLNRLDEGKVDKVFKEMDSNYGFKTDNGISASDYFKGQEANIEKLLSHFSRNEFGFLVGFLCYLTPDQLGSLVKLLDKNFNSVKLAFLTDQQGLDLQGKDFTIGDTRRDKYGSYITGEYEANQWIRLGIGSREHSAQLDTFVNMKAVKSWKRHLDIIED